MRLGELLEVADVNREMEVIDDFFGEILAEYNGRDSIPECYNVAEVSGVSIEDGRFVVNITWNGRMVI